MMFSPFALVILLVILILMGFNVLREYERAVIFRWGRLSRGLVGGNGPGVVIILPFIDKMVRVSLRTVAMDVPPQDVITKDNVSVKVNAVIYFRVVDQERAIIQVEDYLYATSMMSQTTLRSVLGQSQLDDLLSKREQINADLQRIIDQQTEPWGVKVTAVEVKNVDLPQEMQRAIARQAEAERERRAKVIHADIDPAEIGKNRDVDVPIVGDAREVIIELIAALEAEHANGHRGNYAEWLDTTLGWKQKYTPGYETFSDGSLAPQYVIERLSALSDPDTIFASGVGQHQMWSSQFIDWKQPRTWLNSGGAGTMGFSVPAAMGAKVAAPGRTVWSIDGDGCFQMTNQELVTCAINEIPIKVALINNSSLGMVRQWQTLFYNERYSNTDLHSHRIPDFVKLAEAYGCHGLRCESPADVDKVIKQAQSLNDAPVVIDFIVHRDAMVWPMVAAGTSNDDIKIARDLAPQWYQGE